MDIILYLLQIIQYLYQQNCWLIQFICRYIPLKQWAFDDSHSPKYQKFKTDQLPVIIPFIKQDWQFLLQYYIWKYGKPVKPVQRRNGKPFLKTLSVLSVVLPIITSMITMAAMVNTSAKSADKLSVTVKISLLRYDFFVLTAVIPWFPKKTANTLLFTNVSIPNVPITYITLKRWIKRILMKTMVKTNINFTTSTDSSRWISLTWT